MVLPGHLKNNLFLLLLLTYSFFACEDDTKKNTQKEEKQQPIKTTFILLEKPEFNEGSAYLYVQQQVYFGPRCPNDDAHGKCANFLINKLASFGFSTQMQ